MPAVVNRTAYVPEDMDIDDRNRRSPVLVTLCGVDPSRNRHFTESPTPIRATGLLMSMFLSVTDVVAPAAEPGRARSSSGTARRRRMPGLLPALLCGSLVLAGCGGAGGKDGRLRYGVIGDSYSNGEAVGRDAAWPTLLAQRLDLDLVVNPAVSGWTTQQALDEELPAFEAADPDVATLLIGVNDLVQGESLAAIRGRFAELLDRMIAIVGGPDRVVVVTVPDFSIKPAGAAYGNPAAVRPALAALNAMERAEAERRHVAVADVVPASRRSTAPPPDGLHPAAAELRAWTGAIAPVAREAWEGVSP